MGPDESIEAEFRVAWIGRGEIADRRDAIVGDARVSHCDRTATH
jgi:hypothetical protein